MSSALSFRPRGLLRPRHKAVLIASAGLGSACLLSGCESFADNRGADSILELGAPASPEEAARMAINQFNADERARGTLLLANSFFGGESIYLELYEDNIDDWDAGVRAAAVRALGIHGLPEHGPLIVERLDDEDERVRLEAARTLQRIHTEDAVQPLLDRIAEPVIGMDDDLPGESDPQVRAEAAHALGQYAQPQVIEGLIRALDDRQLAVNIAARQSLRTLTGQDFGEDSAAWLDWYASTEEPFRGRTAYVYPVFERGRRLVEYLPLTPPPPNEAASTPVGMPPVRREGRATTPPLSDSPAQDPDNEPG